MKKPMPKPIVRWQLDNTIAVVIGPDSFGTMRRKVVFPHIGMCNACEGISGYGKLSEDGQPLYGKENFVEDPDKAYEIALVQFGFSSIQFWDNSPPRKCSEACRFERDGYKHKPKWWNDLLVSDSGWRSAPGARPNYGWHPYERELVFKDTLTESQLSYLNIHFKHDRETPSGQGKANVRHIKGTTYHVTAHCDSGD